MKKDGSLVSIEKNKGCNINLTIGETDKLSPLNIYNEKNDILSLENAFSDRIGYTCSVLNTNVLPMQLRNDFEIKPKIVDDKIEYYAKAKTDDAYEKYPLKMKFSMEFPNREEAEKFLEAGFDNLQKDANTTQKPVEVPYITTMKEFLGDYENPLSYINKHGWEGAKLYLMPKPLPPAQEYIIEIFNGKNTFKLNTKLKMTKTTQNGFELTNKDSCEEPFNVTLKMTSIKKDTIESETVRGKFNLTVSIKKKLLNDCSLNLELIKFRFLTNDTNNTIIIKNSNLDKEVFRFTNTGSIKYSENDFEFFNKVVGILEKIIYISKVKNVNIDYDLDNFIKNEEYINLLVSEISGDNYTIDKKTYWTLESNETDEVAQDENISVITTFLDFNLFGETIELKKHRIILYDCKVLDTFEIDGKKKFNIEANKVIFELL